tara:strand:+ start:126 stop:686 length:561 start_codon:yes stop_codon:yes gene_type:complete
MKKKMSNVIGVSAGVWNSGSKVYPNPEFSNASGQPFWKEGLSVRTIYRTLGTTWSQAYKRRPIYEALKKNFGLSDLQINTYWTEYQNRGNSDINAFTGFVENQIKLKKREIERENQILAEIKEEEKNEIIRDIEVVTSTVGATTPDPKDVSSNKTAPQPKPTNYLLYGGIGLAVIIGGFILIKKIK